jgi:uncharacterized membrane protein
MNRQTQVLIAGAGFAAGFGVLWALGRKRINTLPYGRGMKIKTSVTVVCSPEQAYAYWRNLTNIPDLLDNDLSVEIRDIKHSHWTLKVAPGVHLDWDAEITVDREDEMVGWRSLDGGDLDIAGYVRFEPVDKGRSTVVTVALQHNPPTGKLGVALSTLIAKRPSGQVERALQRFKQLMEGKNVEAARKKARSMESVEVASEDSFPASDPPSWTGTTGPIGL